MARPRDNRKVEINMSSENADNRRSSRKFRTPRGGANKPPPVARSKGAVATLDTPFRRNVACRRAPERP